MISFVACHSTVLEDPLSLFNKGSPYVDDGGTSKDFIKQSTNVLSLKSFEQLGDISPSLKTVKVSDYGAQGDGKTDDTQVYD